MLGSSARLILQAASTLFVVNMLDPSKAYADAYQSPGSGSIGAGQSPARAVDTSRRQSSASGAVPFSSNSRKEATYRPTVAATWAFGSIAVKRSAEVLLQGGSAADAVETGINAVEEDNQEQYYVGYGGFPNANGVMECDAAMMDSELNYGAAMSIPRTTRAASVARSIMDHCVHNVLTGEGALQWAASNGLPEFDPLTEDAVKAWREWKQKNKNNPLLHRKIKGSTVVDARKDALDAKIMGSEIDPQHDTVGVICLDKDGNMCAGTSTSGWAFKHPGRVGDSPIVGSGLYCDGQVGAAVATGDGEEIMRSCLCFLVVEFMRNGDSPQEACRKGIARLQSQFDTYQSPEGAVDSAGKRMHSRLTVGVVAMNRNGIVGGASTVDEENLHRNNAYFPVACWSPPERNGGDGSNNSAGDSDSDNVGSVRFIEASRAGATYT